MGSHIMTLRPTGVSATPAISETVSRSSARSPADLVRGALGTCLEADL